MTVGLIVVCRNKGALLLIYVIFRLRQDYPEQYLPVSRLATYPVPRVIDT